MKLPQYHDPTSSISVTDLRLILLETVKSVVSTFGRILYKLWLAIILAVLLVLVCIISPLFDAFFGGYAYTDERLGLHK